MKRALVGSGRGEVLYSNIFGAAGGGLRPATRRGRTCLQASRGVSSASRRAGKGESVYHPVAVVVLHRHGQRAPGVNIGSFVGSSSAPDQSSTTSGEGGAGSLAAPAQAPAAGGPFDADDKFLWKKWMVPLEEQQRLQALFPVEPDDPQVVPSDQLTFPFGCLTTRGLAHLKSVGRALRSRYGRFRLAQADVFAYSTTYRRTQLSVQSLLEGMLDTGGGVAVRVRGQEQEFLNAFDSDGPTMTRLMREVVASPDFARYEDTEGRALQTALQRAAPEVFDRSASSTAPQPWQWMSAADFFWCREAHDIPLPEALRPLAAPTSDHLVWRFQQYYAHPQLLSNMVSSRSGRNSDSLSLTLLSTHDVTIFSLLTALQSHLVRQGGKLVVQQQERAFWPHYGIALSFELLQRRARHQPPTAEAGAPTHVRVLVDQSPLQSPLFPQGEPVPLTVLEAALQRQGLLETAASCE